MQSKESINGNFKDVTLEIKEEQLDIIKTWVQTGEVRIHRETFTEEKNYTVPVIHEELVIERKSLSSSVPESSNTPEEIIRIPLSVEHVEFTKHRVALEDVSIYKQKIEDIKHIEETLKREEAKIKVSGSPRVRDESGLERS